MIIAEWSFNVPKEKLREFLEYSRKKLKPFWESHGAVSYSLFQCISKQYFRHQKPCDETRIVEHICFNNIGEFEAFLKKCKEDKDGEEYEMQKSYEKLFDVTDVSFRVYDGVVCENLG